jgi:hypothetical protein
MSLIVVGGTASMFLRIRKYGRTKEKRKYGRTKEKRKYGRTKEKRNMSDERNVRSLK